MERFIVDNFEKEMLSLVKFKIQYGEIYSVFSIMQQPPQ